MVPLILALVAPAGCVETVGSVRCDEVDTRTCNMPFTSGALTLRTLRTRMPAYPEGQPVNIRGVVVSAVDDYDEDMTGRVGTIYAQEFSPPGNTTDPLRPCPLTPDRRYRVCAISLFAPTLAPSGYRARVGDIVDIVGGGYDEFDCAGVCGTPPQPFDNGRFIPQIARPTATNAGVAPPPVPLPATLAAIDQNNEAYMGLLVTVENVVAMGAPDRRGEIALGAGREGLKLTQQFVAIPGVINGTRWRRVTGIVTYFYGAKLVPRTLADLVQ